MDEEPDQEQLEEQMDAATVALRETILRLLGEGAVHPHLVILAATKISGELGAAAPVRRREKSALRHQSLTPRVGPIGA